MKLNTDAKIRHDWLAVSDFFGEGMAGEAAHELCADIDILLAENKKLQLMAKAGYALSTYAAAVTWAAGDNTAEWLVGLKDKIIAVQSANKQLSDPVELPGTIQVNL